MTARDSIQFRNDIVFARAAPDSFVEYETVQTSMDYVVFGTTNIRGPRVDIDLGPTWPTTTLLLRGFAMSTEELENGLVAWVDDLARALAEGAIGKLRYYLNELGIEP